MPRFFPFTDKAPTDFKSSLISTCAKNDRYTQGGKFTPMVGVALTTIFGALQLALDNVLTDDKTTVDNTATSVITTIGAVSFLLTNVFGYLGSSTQTTINNLTTLGAQSGYFLPSLSLFPPTAAAMEIASASTGEAKAAELTESQKLVVDGLVKRFTR